MVDERMARLETEVKNVKKFLFDNGQPGWVSKVESRLEAHSRAIWIGMAILGVLQFLSANGWLRIH